MIYCFIILCFINPFQGFPKGLLISFSLFGITVQNYGPLAGQVCSASCLADTAHFVLQLCYVLVLVMIFRFQFYFCFFILFFIIWEDLSSWTYTLCNCSIIFHRCSQLHSLVVSNSTMEFAFIEFKSLLCLCRCIYDFMPAMNSCLWLVIVHLYKSILVQVKNARFLL